MLSALGVTVDEVAGTQFLLDAHDMQLMKDTVARHKEKALLAGVAGLRKPPIKKKKFGKFGGGGGRDHDRYSRDEHSQSRKRDDKTGDDRQKDDANQGSKDGSSQKSTSTPGKPYKGKPRGKGK